MDFDLENLKGQVGSMLRFSPPYLNNIKPSDWAEKNRYMSSDTTPFPGKFSYDKTPYLKEPVDCLSPDHEARVITVIKGSQLGFSTGVIETGIGWIISQNPGNILLSARDEALVKKMMNSKIDPMLDSCGIKHLIRPNSIRKRNQRTGDTDTSKEFSGGALMAVSIQNPSRMRQVSMQYGFLDDFEAAPNDKDAGSASKLFETRFDAYYTKMKLFYISTPETKQTSNIEPLYLMGDQRKYMIPCPCCGDFIELHWNLALENGDKAGIFYKLDNHGRVIDGSVGYVCQSCGGFFDDRKKTDFNLNGFWKPTATPEEKGNYSYHLSSLYAPVGMYDWSHYAKQYNQCCPKNGEIDFHAYKTFVNTTLGETWEERSRASSSLAISKNIRDYDIDLIPNDLSVSDGNGEIVMVTCGCDLASDVVEDGRIDYEIVAWSVNGTSYSVRHGSIGTFVNRGGQNKEYSEDKERVRYSYAENAIWQQLTDILSKIYLDEKGNEYSVSITGIDTGVHTAYVNSYIYNSDLTIFGVKGLGSKIKREDSDSPLFKKSKEQSKLFLLDVNRIKDVLSDHMSLVWNRDIEQPSGFMNFPIPSENKYGIKNFFRHFESEKRVTDKNSGVIWVKKYGGIQNHFYDCRVYNIAMKEILVYLVCRENKVANSEYSFDKYVEIINGL